MAEHQGFEFATEAVANMVRGLAPFDESSMKEGTQQKNIRTVITILVLLRFVFNETQEIC